jgi:putative endonuclease
VDEHYSNLVAGFTRKYGVKTLVGFELLDRINEAVNREKQLKGRNRAWKLKLIDEANPQWQDIANTIADQ